MRTCNEMRRERHPFLSRGALGFSRGWEAAVAPFPVRQTMGFNHLGYPVFFNDSRGRAINALYRGCPWRSSRYTRPPDVMVAWAIVYLWHRGECLCAFLSNIVLKQHRKRRSMLRRVPMEVIYFASNTSTEVGRSKLSYNAKYRRSCPYKTQDAVLEG